MSDGSRDWVTWAGLAIVGLAAAVMSFDALADLARLCNITSVIPLGPVDFHVAWLLPITIDVLAGVTTRVWLRRRTNTEALRFARWSAWSAIAASVAGNAYHGYLTGEGRLDVVLVAAVPAFAVGAMVHLAVLVGRGSDQPAAEGPVRDPWLALLDDVLGEEWDHPIRAWSAAVDAADRKRPGRDEPDEVLAGDLRSENGRLGRPLSRDEVMARYGIGATRADRVRALAEAVGASTVEPAGEAA